MTKRTHHRRRHPDRLRPRPAGEHRQDGSLRARGGEARRAGRAAVGAVPGHLLLHAAGPEVVRDRLSRAPSTRACSRCRSSPRSWASSSRSRSSRRTARATTTASRSPTPTAKSSASIARATSPTAPAIRRSTTSAPATRASRLEDASRHHRRRHLLGPVVPGVRARHGARRRRGAVLSDRHRLGAL